MPSGGVDVNVDHAMCDPAYNEYGYGNPATRSAPAATT